MKKLIWIIPIVLLFLSACVPSPAVDCKSQTDAAYHQGFNDASSEALNALTVDLVPDSIYRKIYNEGFQDGQMCQADLVINYPTTQQVLDFVAQDDTDKILSNPDGFVCADYSNRISGNAWDQNIPCYTVMIVLEYVGGYAMFHDCVAFPVRDSPDLLFIEPQNDLIIHDVVAGSIPYVCADNNGNGFCKFLTEKPVLKVLVNR